MQNDSIVVTAKLNVDASEALILRDLEKIQGDLEKNPLKINCVVSDATLKNIQAQINNIASNLNVNVGVITAQSIMSDNTARHIEQNVQAVQSSLNSIVDTVQNVQNRSNVRMNLQINTGAIDRFINRLNTLGVQGVNIDELRERLQKLDVSIDKITPTFTRLRNGAEVLSTISIKGKDSLGQLIDYTERYRSQVSKTSNQVTTTFNNATTKVTQNFEKIRVAQEKIRKESETNQAALNKFLSLQGKYNVIQSKYGDNAELANQLQTIKQLIDSFNNSAPIEKQQESLIRIDNELKLIAVDIEKIQSKGTLIKSNLYPDISKVAAVGTDNSAQLESAKNQLNEYFKNIAQVEDSVTRIKRAVSDTTGELTKFYIQVEKEDKSVETLTYALNKQGTAYEFVSKAIREADNSTDFRRKGLDVQKAIKTEEVNKFITQLKEANLYTGELKTKADELNNSIAQIADTNAMNKFLDDFDIAKAKFAAMKEESRSHNNSLKDTEKYINDAIKALEKFNNASVTKRNASNTDVITQTGTNANLITQLQGLSQSLKDDSSATNLQRVRQVIDTLSGSIEKATTDSAALNQQLINTSADDRLSNHINNLINQMNKFANTNPKVTKSLKQMRDEMTFADKWQQMVNMLQSGKLDGNAVQQLTNDFRNFKGEADSANLTTSRFFTSMQSQLRMVLQRWISLYAVIGYIRKMIDNVKELDNAMINLRRVTDETDAGYQRFLEDANQLARQMKTTTSSLIEMSYQWSKLGFAMDEALELSKASTIFMRVADVGQDQALSNLVTSLKAFRLEASQTMDVVDKLDKLNNEYAVSAAGLGGGLERSASAMAMSGNTLEETLAMLTGAGEITQNLENTGNGIKILSLRLRGMKGALEELNEPVDDLMEVSKIQTQILNLTHNQVNIFDEATQEFRSTYDIMKDISDIWDSLSSTSRANLTEILFGKQRANIGLALIQAFQSGQVQSAFEDATNAAGTATEEYDKMMQGIQAQLDDFKGAFQEFSNAFINSDLLKGLVKFGTQFIQLLTTTTDKVGGLVVVLTPLLMYFGAKTRTNIFTAIINGFKGLITAETGAITATGALSTAVKVLGGALSGLAIGAIIAGISYLADKLIVTAAETEESIREITSDVGDLANATEELEKSQADIESIAQSYSKIATTVGDVNDRKTQLLELQGQLTDKFKEEANGIDLVNGKYSDQIRQLQKLEEEQRKQYELENADKIARARRLANLRVDDIYKVSSSPYEGGYDQYSRDNDKKGERALFTIRDIDERAIRLATTVEGAYASLQGTLDAKGVYLSGTLEDARNQLKQIIDNYSKLSDVDSKTLEKLTARYKELNDALNNIKEVTPYIEDIELKPVFTGIFDGLSDAVNQAVSDVTMQPFYDKLDEAQDKLKQLANPSDLTIAEYDTLYRDVQKLEGELYKMAGDSEDSRQAVTDLFNAFKQGISENGDSLEKFVEQFNTTLEESFKQVAETVTGVQDAMSKLAEGKGLSHSDAWKLLKEDTDGYLQSIKLVNGEYFFSQEELVKFKDAKIKASMEALKASNEQYVQERKNQLALLETQKEALKLALENLNVKAAQGSATKAELDAVTKARIAIAETEDSIKRYEGLWKRNNLLIEELNQNLGETRTLSLATETELNNAVKALENEAKAVDDTIDSLNNRKDVLESEKKELQEQLDILNEQKKVIEEQQKSFQKAVTDYLKRYEDSLKSQLDSLKQQQDDIKDEYEERIKVLKNENEERDLAYKKEKALLDLNKAKQQQVRTYSSARGWEYGASKEKVVEAQKNLDDVLNEEQIKALEKERDEKIKPLEKQEKALDHQIKAYEEYVKQYDVLTEEIENKDGELLAEQLLGSDWREKIENKDEGLLRAYKQEYENFTVRLEQLTKVEIKNIEDGIKAKEEDIDKIGEEITAYNNYKTTVQTKLGEAKTELENYKNNVSDYCSQISDSFYHMQDEIRNNHNKIIGWFGAVAAAARSMRDEIGSGAVGGALMGLHLAGFADGGTNSTTGIAMLHGTKQKSETIFNANDSKKLYEAVHETPSVMASIIKQAVQLSGFNPSNIVNNNGANTNSVNVNIGQVVANNPQDFVRNLDPHLDAYFKRKLTQSYTQ